jgi:F-box interacting protein
VHHCRRNLGPENGCLSFESLLERLPVDIQDSILERLNFEDLSRTKVVSKLFKDHIDSDEFHLFRGRMRPKEFSLSPLHFSSGKHGIQQFEGYDLISREWKRLPPIPVPDPDLFKDFNICGAGGIMCANVSAPSSMHEKMIVFNPLTGRSRELPPLNHRRTPVLMHLTLNSTEESYKIIVAGSARAGQENLSRVIEIFDSRTSMWTIAQDLPGPLFALNEYQTGVCSNGVLYCIAALEGKNSSKGILAFSVDEGIWLLHLSFPLANSTNSNIVQLVENSGEIFLFSEIEHSDRLVEHRVDLLEGVTLRTDLRSVTNSAQCTGEWRNVMSRLKVGGRSLLVYPEYPEYTCVPFGEGMLCIFNTIVHTGTVYDVRTHGQRIETLPSPSWNGSGERGLYSANPLTFCFEPSFKGKP